MSTIIKTVTDYFTPPINQEKENTIIIANIYLSIEYLLSKGLKEKGLFRESGSHKNISAMQENIKHGLCISFQGNSIFDVGDLLKRCITSLQILNDAYDELININTENYSLPPSRNFIEIIEKLPETKQLVLSKIIRFLHILSLYTSTNKMSTENIAKLFAEVLLPTSDPLQIMSDNTKKVKLIKYIIENYGAIFDPLSLIPIKHNLKQRPRRPSEPTSNPQNVPEIQRPRAQTVSKLDINNLEDLPASIKEETHKRTKSETKEIRREANVYSKTDKKFDINENTEVVPDRCRLESFSNESPKSIKEENLKKIFINAK